MKKKEKTKKQKTNKQKKQKNFPVSSKWIFRKNKRFL